jgi:putative resolvase
MKLSVWAKQQGIQYKTAWQWFRAGILPVPSTQLSTGTILVHPPEAKTAGRVALYARVSSHDQKADLDRQTARLVTWATEHDLQVAQTVTEIGSGLNGHRSRLLGLLKDPTIETIVVEHRDRLARFGSEYVEAALAAGGRKVMVVDETEMKDDLVRDIIDVLTSMCARLYGRRSAKNRAQKALAALRATP